MRYPAQEKAWVRRILVRLTPEQRARYEVECQEAGRHRNGRLYDEERARIAERILYEDAMRRGPPPPPSGPQAEEYSDEEGRPAAYDAFLDTAEGRAFWVALKAAALARLREGEARFSTRSFLAWYRDQHRVRINNIFSPWLADDLVAEHPELLDIIERRRRRKPGPER